MKTVSKKYLILFASILFNLNIRPAETSLQLQKYIFDVITNCHKTLHPKAFNDFVEDGGDINYKYDGNQTLLTTILKQPMLSHIFVNTKQLLKVPNLDINVITLQEMTALDYAYKNLIDTLKVVYNYGDNTGELTAQIVRLKALIKELKQMGALTKRDLYSSIKVTEKYERLIEEKKVKEAAPYILMDLVPNMPKEISQLVAEYL